MQGHWVQSYGGKVKVRQDSRLVPFVMSESYLKVWMSMHPAQKRISPLSSASAPRVMATLLSTQCTETSRKERSLEESKRITPIRSGNEGRMASTRPNPKCAITSAGLVRHAQDIRHLSGRDIDNVIYTRSMALNWRTASIRTISNR